MSLPEYWGPNCGSPWRTTLFGMVDHPEPRQVGEAGSVVDSDCGLRNWCSGLEPFRRNCTGVWYEKWQGVPGWGDGVLSGFVLPAPKRPGASFCGVGHEMPPLATTCASSGCAALYWAMTCGGAGAQLTVLPELPPCAAAGWTNEAAAVSAANGAMSLERLIPIITARVRSRWRAPHHANTVEVV